MIFVGSSQLLVRVVWIRGGRWANKPIYTCKMNSFYRSSSSQVSASLEGKQQTENTFGWISFWAFPILARSEAILRFLDNGC